MRVKEIMTGRVETCRSDTVLTEAARRMWTAGCGAIPVVDANAKVVGIITDRDISMTLANTGRRPAHIPVSESMTRHVFACGPDDDVRSALEALRTHKVRRLPVLSDGGHLLGILSIDDILVRGDAAGGPTATEVVDALRSIVRSRTSRVDREALATSPV
jgi:CBS domain-containing protein